VKIIRARGADIGNLGDPLDAGEQTPERGRTLDNHLRAARREHRHIANKVDRIPQTLLTPNEHGPAVQGLALPLRRIETAPVVAPAQAPLVMRPAFRETAAREQMLAITAMRVDMVWIGLERALERDAGTVPVAQ